jgi:hypothetical protein
VEVFGERGRVRSLSTAATVGEFGDVGPSHARFVPQDSSCALQRATGVVRARPVGVANVADINTLSPFAARIPKFTPKVPQELTP